MEDLSRFKQTYFEESAELLEAAETGLLGLAPGILDDDRVNAIFRAVHSIKGGGGAFGFRDLVAFAHEFETVMDGLRNGAIPLTAELIDTLIRANDLLGRLLGLAREDRAAPDDLTTDTVESLRRYQKRKNASAKVNGGKTVVVEMDDFPADEQAGLYEEAMAEIRAARADLDSAGNTVDGGGRVWTIHFSPKPDLLLSGNEPVFMLGALAQLGQASILCHTGKLPPLAELDAELLYLSWTVTLVTGPEVSRDQIEDVFEFVRDDSHLEIIASIPDNLPPPGPTSPDLAPVFSASGQARDDHANPRASSLPELPAGRGGDLQRQGGSALTLAAGETAGAGGKPRPGGRRKGETEGRGSEGLAAHSIRVDLDKIDRLVNMVGEMVITQAMIAEHVRQLPPGEFQELLEGLEQMAQHTRELRESVMSIRAQPVSSVFSRMPRLVRDCAMTTGKEVQLVTSGENTEVDKTVVENLVDPLTHMIRNSIDHGLETPDDRERAGKPRAGTVHLSAQHRSGRIVIEIIDDGRGINRPKVLSKAMEKGLVPPGTSLSDEEIDNLIFLPGFSTADQVSDLSGRGVGMDVVRRNITSLGGRIVVHSTPGEGSRFVLSLPLTLAVLDGMVISVGEDRFVLPLTNIVESLRPTANDLHGLVGQCDVMMARGEYVRLVHLHALFGIPDAETDPTRALVVLVETEDGSRLGLVVDEVLGQQQVVIKSMEANFRRLDGVAAATILGDGRVALILDVAGLREMSRMNPSATGRGRLDPENALHPATEAALAGMSPASPTHQPA